MLEQADDGSAVTVPPPPPPPPFVLVFPAPSLLPPPPPHPAAMNASTAKTPMNATALTLLLTLASSVARVRKPCLIGGVSGLGRLDATRSRSRCRHSAESGETSACLVP